MKTISAAITDVALEAFKSFNVALNPGFVDSIENFVVKREFSELPR